MKKITLVCLCTLLCSCAARRQMIVLEATDFDCLKIVKLQRNTTVVILNHEKKQLMVIADTEIKP